MCSLMAFAPSSSGFCACAAHEPLPTRATKAVVKKSGKIAEAPPSAAAGWKPSIFLDFEGARTPALERGERHHEGDSKLLRQLATGQSRTGAPIKIRLFQTHNGHSRNGFKLAIGGFQGLPPE